MKTFVNAVLSVMMFASMPVYAATGILVKKDVVFEANENYSNIAYYGKSKDGKFSKCWVGSYRYGNAVANNIIPAGTVFPIKDKENNKVFPDIDGFGSLWKITSSVYAPLGTRPDTFDIRVSCTDSYSLFMSFPNASEAISLFPEYVEEVELD